MQALIIKQDGKVYYIADLPKESDTLSGKVFYDEAINSAIMVKNQEYSEDLLWKKCPPFGPKVNTPIEFPDLKVRIEQLLSDPPITVAIIEEEKGEDLSDEEIIKIYRDYVGAAETHEDRLQRIQNFRCKKF